ncbi:MAG: NADH-quinone oxidoreductase subunit H [Spirochaetales bacterium]|nr:NADH-quinone oxidoreductase subunit H [Spirochaetales bacterium]
MLFTIFNSLLAVLLTYSMGMLYYGFYRIGNARIHRRVGPPLWQNVIDNIKLFAKREAPGHGIMFHLGPVIMTAGTITSMLFVPFLKDSAWLQGFSSYGNLILLIYLMVVGPLGNALAVGVSGVPFGVMGVTRGLTRLIGLEVPFFLSVALLMSGSGTISISEIMMAQDSFSNWNMMAHPAAFIVSLFSFVGMMGASPFDVVGAPVEVYSGPQAEFGGKYLGFLAAQRVMFSMVKLILWVDLFLGGATNVFILMAKSFALFFFYFIVGAAFPRFKTEQAVDFMLKLPLIIGIGAVLVRFWSL